MEPVFKFSHARVRGSGDEIEIADVGVTCIVGGNNVGKSRLLRDLETFAVSGKTENLVTVDDVRVGLFEKSSLEEVEYWLRRTAAPSSPDMFGSETFAPLFGGVSTTAENAHRELELMRTSSVFSQGLGNLRPFLVWRSNAGNLQRLAQFTNPDRNLQNGAHPLHRMFWDGDIEAGLSDLAMRAFGVAVTLDRLNPGSDIRIGRPSMQAPPVDRPDVRYAAEMRRLPLLSDQGDGMKSMLGLALLVLTGSWKSMLIDEPEVFLHPPQARALGRWLARQAKERELQLVLATHDRDVLLGVLSEPSQDASVIRISRTGSENRMKQLTAEDIRRLWRAPAFRYSNMMQGLFHAQVVVCESDADCRFFGAVLDSVSSTEAESSVYDDTLFVPAGGKSRIHELTAALVGLDVETWAILDFDVLNSWTELVRIIESMGLKPTDDMSADYKVVVKDLNPDAGWARAKTQGLAALSSGVSHEAGRRLLMWLSAARIIVVPVGEMEHLDRGIAGHGAEWVSGMLEASRHTSCQLARDLIFPLVRSAHPVVDGERR